MTSPGGPREGSVLTLNIPGRGRSRLSVLRRPLSTRGPGPPVSSCCGSAPGLRCSPHVTLRSTCSTCSLNPHDPTRRARDCGRHLDEETGASRSPVICLRSRDRDGDPGARVTPV